MLSGIKVGKRKRKTEETPATETNTDAAAQLREQLGTTAAAPTSNDPSIEDMIREEKMRDSHAEERNILRLTKHKSKLPKFHDSDDEERYMESLTKESKKSKTTSASSSVPLQELASKCWWWMESPQFDKSTLLAIGNHVSLVMVPAKLALSHGKQFYLVPVGHAESLRNCDDEVWNEIRYFQESLRKMYPKQDLVWFETVIPRTKGVWQTRFEGVVVPKEVAQDAPLFFQTSLKEITKEGEAHSKILRTSKAKPLVKTIPKDFPYVYVEFEENDGFCQILEDSNFPRNFAIDTLGGIMHMDPLRMQQKVSPDVERSNIQSFLEKWKEHDWTLKLDE